jgi:hypothetical protein
MYKKILDLLDGNRRLVIVKDEDEECVKVQSTVTLSEEEKKAALRRHNYATDSKTVFQVEHTLYRKPENYINEIVSKYRQEWEEKRI